MTAGGVKELMPAAEAWNCTFEMQQTLTGLTNGIYMLQANAAFRPAGDYLSTLHGAILRAGGNVNFVMVEGEDLDVINQVARRIVDEINARIINKVQ